MFRLSEILAEKDRVFGTSVVDGGGRQAWQEAKAHPEVRRLLQRTGTEAGRMLLGEDVWIDAALPLNKIFDHVVVADVRFPNEAKRVKDHGGTIIRIDHPERGPLNAHPSEMKVLEIEADIVVKNDGTIADLHAKAAQLS